MPATGIATVLLFALLFGLRCHTPASQALLPTSLKVFETAAAMSVQASSTCQVTVCMRAKGTSLMLLIEALLSGIRCHTPASRACLPRGKRALVPDIGMSSALRLDLFR